MVARVGVAAALVLFTVATVLSSGATGVAHGTRSSSTAADHIRVNQVGYVTDGSKVAYLLTTDPCIGTFTVLDAATPVFTGPIGADLGRWNAQYRHVCALDFDALVTPGRYTIEVGGASSVPFDVEDSATLYEPLLANALTFYRGQRDGRDVDPTVLLRRPSHLHDARAVVYQPPVYRNERLVRDLRRVGSPVDVAGGWFDAGDYVKFTGTTAFAVTVMELAVRDHPSLFSSGGPALEAEARRGVRWLLKMYDQRRDVLYYQVGIGSGGKGIWGDHDLWRLPQRDDSLGSPHARYLAHRPVFRTGPPGSHVPPSLAGRMAAALGLCAQLWPGSQLAGHCLDEGQAVYASADTTDVRRQLTASPVSYYREDEWRSDLELGGVELFRALAARGAPDPEPPVRTPRAFLRQAAHWGHTYRPMGDTLNLYDIGGIAHPELITTIHRWGARGLATSRAELTSDLRRQLTRGASAANHDAFHFGASPWDPTPHAFGLTAESLAYDQVTRTQRFQDLATWQLDWALGANAWGTSFVVGAGSTFPHCMQHQIANLRGSTDGSSPLLAGATVDGPSSYIPGRGFFDNAVTCPADGVNGFAAFDQTNWRYVDRVSSWSTVEPSLDYTAMSLYAFAAMAAH